MNSSGKSLNTSEQLILEKLPWELRQLLERFEIGAMDDAVGDDTDRIRKEVVDDYFRRIHSA